MSFHAAILQEPSDVHTAMEGQTFVYEVTATYNIFRSLQ